MLTLQEQKDLNLETTRRVVQLSNQLQDQIRMCHEHIFDLIWHTDGVDPQKIFDLLGAEQSLLLFQASSGVQQLLKLMDEKYASLIPPKVPDATKLTDGTFTLIPNPEIKKESR